jgi:hypothetical protein
VLVTEDHYRVDNDGDHDEERQGFADGDLVEEPVDSILLASLDNLLLYVHLRRLLLIYLYLKLLGVVAILKYILELFNILLLDEVITEASLILGDSPLQDVAASILLVHSSELNGLGEKGVHKTIVNQLILNFLARVIHMPRRARNTAFSFLLVLVLKVLDNLNRRFH